jgi:hypothetical protein
MEMPRQFHFTRLRLISSLAGISLLLVQAVTQAEYTIQVGAFADQERATGLVAQLRYEGFPCTMHANATGSSHLTRVRVGPYPDRATANAAYKRLGAMGVDGFLVSTAPSRSGNTKNTVDTPLTIGDIPRPGETAIHLAQADSDESMSVGEPLFSGTQSQPATLTAQNEPVEVPQSKDDLFGTSDEEPSSMEELFGTPDEEPSSADELFGTSVADDKTRLSGFFQSKFAYTYKSPNHASLFRNLLEVGRTGRFNNNISWKISARGAYDAVFNLTDHYSNQVENNRQWEGRVDQTYVDVSAGDWDFRLGRQNIIWGEMVGLFFADVVSAKDTRQWVAQDFDLIRIPQWATRAEYFKGDFHTEAIWIPFPTYDEIGKPGDDFYPIQETSMEGLPLKYKSEDKPTRDPTNSAYGLRTSILKSGWDISGFYYRSVDQQPAFFREINLGPNPEIIIKPDHKKIHQFGATLAKDFSMVLLKAEAIFTKGRYFAVDNLNDDDGVVKQDTLDYVIGLERNLADGTLVNFQIFQRWYTDHDSDIAYDEFENGASFFTQKDFNSRLGAEFLFISSLNRPDWMARPRVTWNLNGNWTTAVGMDIFGGKSKGLIGGRFEDSSRIYVQARYTF